jgi:hypothetical protein
MCLSCGCHKPMDDHGNPDNITIEDLRKAAEAAGIDPSKAAGNILESMKAA